MAGPWEQYQSASESGPWQKYGAAPPTSAPPPVPKPPNPILTQEEGWDPITPGNAATGFLKSLYQTSAPGIAASILQKHAPQAAQSIPESLQGMPLEQVPAAAIATFFGGEEPTTQLAEHTVTAPGAMSLPKIGKPGMVSRVAEHLPVIGKGVKLYNLGREMFGQNEAPPAPAPPAPVPQTNGIEWGSGGQGPLDLRGKAIPPDAQALPAIEKPAPRSTWPPNAPRYNPESKVELPKPKPFRDVQEDQMIQDAMRQDLSQHEQSAAMTAAKEFAAGNSMATPKSTLIERARDQMNPWSNQPKAPEAPAKPVAPSKPVAPQPPTRPEDFNVSTNEPVAISKQPQDVPFGAIKADPAALARAAERAKGFDPERAQQSPVTVIPNGDGTYLLDDGYHRYTAMSAKPPATVKANIKLPPEESYALRTPTPPSEDLTGILRQSVEQARKKKASQQ